MVIVVVAIVALLVVVVMVVVVVIIVTGKENAGEGSANATILCSGFKWW